MKKINLWYLAFTIVLILTFSVPVNANTHFHNLQTVKVSAKTSFSSKQSSMQYAARRSYRSNRSYRPTAPRSNYRTPRSSGRNFLGYAGAFGIGSLFGSMLHPFGGYYGGQQFGFSFFSLLFDILIIVAIIWFVKKIFRRGNRNHY